MADDSLLDVAAAFAVDAVSPAEREQIRRRRSAADPTTRAEFDRRVRAARDAMAAVSDTTAIAPPATLRDRVLALPDMAADTSPANDRGTGGVRPLHPVGTGTASGDDGAAQTGERAPSHRDADESGRDVGIPGGRRTPRSRALLAAAAAVVLVAVGAAGWVVGQAVSRDDAPAPATAEQVFTARDVRSSTTPVATGRITVTFSDSVGAGVVVMNDVPPPQPGTVYQMWLVGPGAPRSAGTMSDRDVAPSTTAVIPGLRDATALAFTVEPPGGSPAPSGAYVAQLPLS